MLVVAKKRERAGPPKIATRDATSEHARNEEGKRRGEETFVETWHEQKPRERAAAGTVG